MIIKTIPLGSLGANFYIIKDEETGDIFIIDPGAEADVAINAINELNGNLRYIILTHAHVDHICALDEVKKCFDVPVVIHQNDASALNDASVNLCFLLGEKTPSICADIVVKDADTLPFGSSKLKFIHTPGHTKGSMCILYSDALFSGDTLFSGSIGRTDFPGGSFEEISHSIKNKLYTLPSETQIYPGHGEKTTVKYEKENNPFIRG